MSTVDTIEKFASSVYIEDKTGENFIENIVHGTNLPSLLKKLGSARHVLECGYGEGSITAPAHLLANIGLVARKPA
ncbi:MAG: Class SAM-dependent methyltransferase [Rhodospirillales bacterium]|nr:Class SAM-dependent methyltransferase [Rhodospirillales bacterium]